MRSTKAPRSGCICNSCFFIFQCPGGLEQGGSVDIVSRANKAPAGLCLARGGDPPLRSTKAPRSGCICKSCFFIFQCPGGLEQGDSVDAVSRANKALHRIHRSLSKTTTTPAPRLNLCRGSTSYTTVSGCCGRKPWISRPICTVLGRWSSCWPRSAFPSRSPAGESDEMFLFECRL